MKRVLISIFSIGFLISLLILLSSNKEVKPSHPANVLTNPIMFVTLMPGRAFEYQLQTFSNHLAAFTSAPRGSNLNIMYPDGVIRNLTADAHLGVDPSQVQGDGAIGVRQPCIHWSGKKALVSIIVGGPTKQYDYNYLNNKWQIYEVTGFGEGETVSFRKIANQPDYNNISPAYAADGQIFFISDAPIFMKTQLYPQRDEYETASSVTGIFKLDEVTGKTVQIEHAPSGVFDLTVSVHPSDGRVFFTKWDHLKRDQEADHDRYDGATFGSVDMTDESATATIKIYPQMVNNKLIADNRGVRYDLMPEALNPKDPTKDPNEAVSDFNHFMFWEINADGSGEEVVNHAGRHEFGGTFTYGSKLNDPNLTYLLTADSKNALRGTFGSDAGLFQVKEDPNKPGTFYGTYAHEFSRCASGRIIEFSLPIGANPEDMNVIDWTNPHLDDDPYGDNPATQEMTGHYRNPIMLTNGTMLVSHTPEYIRQDIPKNIIYNFRIKPLVLRYPNNPASTEHIAGTPLTGINPIIQTIKYWDENYPTAQVYTGPMNEVDVVEVVARPAPTERKSSVDPIEKGVFAEESVDINQFQKWLSDNNLALIVSRNVTKRDRADVQQPFNLKVPGGVSTMSSKGGIQYDISHLQIFQADMTRAYKFPNSPGLHPGRRTFATPLHNSVEHPNVADVNVPNPSGPVGSVKIGLDGSVAALVPAGRALTWQTTDATGKGVVRERNWLSFAKGEIRTCASCHAVNKKAQDGTDSPVNKPQALRDLLTLWKKNIQSGLPPVIPPVTGGVPPVISNPTDVTQLTLFQNYPNPFDQSTLISYYLPKNTSVIIKIYNSSGSEIRTLVNENESLGSHEISWDGKSNTGQKVKSGIYVYGLQTGDRYITKKMSFYGSL